LRETGLRPFADVVVERLVNRSHLVVLDNCEHLLAAVPWIADLLATAGRDLRILATSRAPLRLAAEREYSVPPLALPDPRSLPPYSELAELGAVKLFVDRARAVRPDLALTPTNAAAVAEICVRLDGLPLAIELAAARMRLLSAQALRNQMDGRLRLLTGGRRDAPARQRTMRDAIAWSYELLAPAEQQLFWHLAVFAGGFTLEAAGAILEPSDELDVVEGVATLAEQSLLRPLTGNNREGDLRVGMLETVREFALEQLEAAGELQELRRRHADYYLALAEASKAARAGPDHAIWLDRLEAEHDNVRAALEWMYEQGDAEATLRFCAALVDLWRVRGHLSEAHAWLQRALSAADDVPPTLRARALNNLGNVATDEADHRLAETCYMEAEAIWRELGDQLGMADVLNNLGLLASDRHDYVRARLLLQESLALRRQLGVEWPLAFALVNLGIVTYRDGDLDGAVMLMEEAHSLFAQAGDQTRLGYVLAHLGEVHRRRGDLAAAQVALQEALRFSREIGYLPGIAEALTFLGRTFHDREDLASATQYLDDALAIEREAWNDLGVAGILSDLAAVASDAGDLPRAVASLQECLSLRWAKADVAGALEAVVQLATVAVPWDAALATRLLRAVEVLQGMIEFPPSLDAASVEVAIVVAKRALGESGFARAWEAGRTLPMREAIAQALAIEMAPPTSPVSIPLDGGDAGEDSAVPTRQG
jgi:predicted ATPase